MLVCSSYPGLVGVEGHRQFSYSGGRGTRASVDIQSRVIANVGGGSANVADSDDTCIGR